MLILLLLLQSPIFGYERSGTCGNSWDPLSIATVEVGASCTNVIHAIPADRSDPINITEDMEWYSSNKAAATVNEAGVVQGVAAGATIITALTPQGTPLEFELIVTQAEEQ